MNGQLADRNGFFRLFTSVLALLRAERLVNPRDLNRPMAMAGGNSRMVINVFDLFKIGVEPIHIARRDRAAAGQVALIVLNRSL